MVVELDWWRISRTSVAADHVPTPVLVVAAAVQGPDPILGQDPALDHHVLVPVPSRSLNRALVPVRHVLVRCRSQSPNRNPSLNPNQDHAAVLATVTAASHDLRAEARVWRKASRLQDLLTKLRKATNNIHQRRIPNKMNEFFILFSVILTVTVFGWKVFIFCPQKINLTL